MLTGWTLSGSVQLRSNKPFTVYYGDDHNGTTQNDARPGDRNTGEGGSYKSLDLAMVRQFHVGSRVLEGRVEAFNIFNNVNYDEYVGSLSAGYVTSDGQLHTLFNSPVTALPPRRIQLAAVLRF